MVWRPRDVPLLTSSKRFKTHLFGAIRLPLPRNILYTLGCGSPIVILCERRFINGTVMHAIVSPDEQ